MNNKAIDVPIYGGFDRKIHCDNSPLDYDSFFQPEIKSMDDLRAYCEEYKSQFPILNNILGLISSAPLNWYDSLSIPMAVSSADESINKPTNGLFLAMNVFSKEEIDYILQHNQLSGDYYIEAQLEDFSEPSSTFVVDNKGADTIPIVQYPALTSTIVQFTQYTPAYKGIYIFVPGATFNAIKEDGSASFPIVLPDSVLEHFSVRGDEISLNEFLRKHVRG